MSLTPEEVLTRRAFDDEVIRSMLPSDLIEIDGFRSRDALERGVVATRADGEAGHVLFYVVRYHLSLFIAAGKLTDGATVLLDASVRGYPHASPLAYVKSRPIPWSPHVHPSTGIVCLGDGWARSKGRMLLAHTIVHVARLLNCDEQDRGSGYHGYNPAAIRYWREVLGRRPITPGLAYPTPSVEITHGIATNERLAAFRLIEDDDGRTDETSTFRLVDADFRIVGAA